MPAKTDDQQSSSTISTSTTPAASRPSTDSSSQDIKPPAAGKKRALLCGVTYSGAGKNISRLKGSVNDVKEIKVMLIKHFGYTDDQSCIRVLTDEENKNELTIPTKKNIEDSLKWLVEGSESGDSLVFFFSGHCTCTVRHDDQVPHDHSENNTPIINNTEHVCLVDCKGEGMIPNYDINSTIVRPLKKGVTLYAIVDACHSGSILDLKYTYVKQSTINADGRWIEKKSDDDQSKARRESKGWEDNKPQLNAEKGTSGGLAICLSACRNDRTAPETNANSSGKGKGEIMGAMTYHLTDMVLKSKHPANVTYEDILKKMQDLHEDRKINEREPLVPISSASTSDLLHKYRKSREIEEPVLSSSLELQVSSEKFLQARAAALEGV